MNISGSISKAGLLLLFMMAMWRPVTGQDTLRTYGPRFGIDLARFIFILADPSEMGAEASVDFEIYRNLYPVFEIGYNSISESEELFNYSASGIYARAGIDYNLLSEKDRSVHHSFTAGARYGVSVFSHSADEIYIPNGYWGDFEYDSYEKELKGHWVELVAGVKAELMPNFFLGWSLRYKFLLNPDMDPLVKPHLVPGFGTGGKDSSFGFTYSILYKIPLFKR
jgi:hypothetical protein